MTARSTGLHFGTTVVAIAGVALLSLSACGGSAGDESTEAPEAPIEASDGGADGGTDDDSDNGGAEGDSTNSEDAKDTGDAAEPEGSDSGSDQDDGVGAGTGDGAEGDGAPADTRTRIVLATDLPSDDQTGDGWPVLSQDDLATLLAEPFDGTATCTEELELAPGTTAPCRGPSSMDMTGPEQEWTAQTARVPAVGEFGEGGRVAVLFTTGSGLTGPAEVLLDEGTELTGVGFGSMFGAEDLSAKDLEDSTLQVLTSKNAYVRVDEAGWASVTCEDGLSFDTFEPTPCTGTTAEGDSFELLVAPGTYADNDQGLLVGIVRNVAN